jgi:hypothetical protein
MKLELTIKTDYLPKWRVLEGLRELFQNARDAEIEFDAPMKVWHRKESNKLFIENDGCTIPHEALLFGHTSKNGRQDLAGKFGEGLALLVLTREGIAVKVRSGSEVWTPKLERSEKFDAKVLCVHIEKGRQYKNRVQIEVTGVSAESYEGLKNLFLFLGNVGDSERIKTSSGSLLLGPRFEHRLFVKGIFVQNIPDLSYGYDLPDVEIDRDRRMVDTFDRGYRLAQVWREAAATRPDLIAQFMKLLESEAADVAGISEWSAPDLSEQCRDHVVSEWKKIHGDDAIPVQTLAESQEVEHLGKRGIVTNKPMRHVLETALGSVMQNKMKLSKEVQRSYGWHELSGDEKASLERALFMVAGIIGLAGLKPVRLSDVDVVDFRDPNIRGMYVPATMQEGMRIQLRKEILGDKDLTLRVFVHEVAHMAGGSDGEKGHVANIEHIWGSIVAKLTKTGAS